MLTYYEYAAFSKTPHALADGLMLVSNTLVKWFTALAALVSSPCRG
jgi:hypothetical protein